MEKLQCTTCGSHQLLEIDNKTFECLSCGVKLKKSDISKSGIEFANKLKDMLSDEVKNSIIRGDEFFDLGNYDKAIIYYNNALDLDVKNTHCREKIKQIEELKEKVTVRFVKQAISTDDCVNYFLHQLKLIQGIPIDIYEKLNITSVEEAYIPFKFYSYHVTGTFTATAIDNYNFAQPWNGRYKAHENGNFYCLSKFLKENEFCFASGDFSNSVAKQFSTSEFQNLSMFNNIPINKASTDITEDIKREALEKSKCSAEDSVKETNITKLKNINLKHEDYLFDFQDFFLPVCTIKYKYDNAEYHWIMSMNSSQVVCAGTCPWTSIKYDNLNSDAKIRCKMIEQDTSQKVANIDEQLNVLGNRVNSINNEKSALENKMLEQVKKPWYIHISDILFLYVPFIALIGYILKSILIGKLILALAIFLVVFCMVVFIRNQLIKKNSIQAQLLYNQEQQKISDKAEEIISKIEETKERLQCERKYIIENYIQTINEIENQFSKPVLEEFAKKLTSDCFWFAEQKKTANSKNKHTHGFYALPRWISVSTISETKQMLKSEHIDYKTIKERKNRETEYKLVLKNQLKDRTTEIAT